MGRPDRLREILLKCSREELLSLAAIVHALPEPPPEWANLKDADLVNSIVRQLGYQGSSNIAFLWRKVMHGRDKAGVPYEEVVEVLVGSTHLNRGLVDRFAEEIADPLYARELLFALLFSLAHPAAAGGGPVEGRPVKELLGRGLAAVKSAGFLPYKQVLEVAQAVARLGAGKGGAPALNVGLVRTLAALLGPVGTTLQAVEAGRAAVALQGPNQAVCALAVATVGALRMKYFPLPLERLAGLEKFVATIDQACPECARPLPGPEAVCVLCWGALHEECGSKVQRIDMAKIGRACGICRRKDLEGDGLLVPFVGTFAPGEWVASAGYRAQVLNNRLDRSAKHIESALLGVMDGARELRREVADDLSKMLRRAFGYLYVMFFMTVFLTLFGIAYFRTSGTQPGGAFNPGVYFRLSLVVMIVLPLGIWFFGALWRASRNAKREEFEQGGEGGRLGLKDYLFGFLYYEHPIENIWGPIALLGTTLAVLMWLFLFR